MTSKLEVSDTLELLRVCEIININKVEENKCEIEDVPSEKVTDIVISNKNLKISSMKLLISLVLVRFVVTKGNNDNIIL